jgi:mitogen-activated protein kinase kinase kinase 9
MNSSVNFSKLDTIIKFKQIDLGYNYVIAISEDNNVYGWGSNQYGQLTLTNVTMIDEPTFIEELSNLSAFKLSAGGYHAMGIFSVNINNLQSNLSKLEANDCKLIEYKKLLKQNMLASTLRNDILNLKEKNKLIEHLKSNINEKLNVLKSKDNTIKELKITEEEINKSESSNNTSRYSNLTRGFDNNFEIPIDEINFENGDEIGKGTFGEVRKGVWRKETVAVKFLKEEMLSSEENIISFIDECNMLKNLRHPNILLFMGASTEPPVFFMVTEYCPNGNLFELLHQRKNVQISWEERRRFTIEIATGMNYLHSFHPPIMHRDLKSMNVLLDKNWQVKIADFGSTKFMEVHNTKHKGTFQWMAPEVIKGSTYTEKADVFSFGIVMSEIAMRLPPYYGIDKKEVALNVMNKSDYRPATEKHNIPREYADLMRKCWEHNSAKRPSFSEVIDILNKMKLK